MCANKSLKIPQIDSNYPKGEVISLRNVGKVYKLYSRPLHRVAEALLPLKNKKYYQEFHALADISFSVKRGETIGIIGQNGSGKSTLLQIVCGIMKPTGGHVVVNGRISALLELGAGFNGDFSGRENVYLNGSILGIERKEMEKRFDDIASFAGIGEFIDQPVKTYSSGMYVRLAFAVAINVNPSILIVDEALSVGDTAFQAKCFAKFKEFQDSGVTILFVTHAMDLVTRYCDRAILLEQGRIVKSGPAKKVVDEYNRRIVNCSENGGPVFSIPIEKPVLKEQKESLTNTSENLELHPNEQHEHAAKAIKPTLKKSPQERIASHMLQSERAYQLNPNENRYGNGKAEIIEVGIDSLGDKTNYSFFQGECYRFWFKTLFHDTLLNPITAYTVKDVKGFDLTGTNTMYKDIEIGKVKKGDIVLSQFEHLMMLNPGGYLLSFGCAGFEDGEYVVYDRRYDVITFDVISDFPSVGIFDLNSKITITHINK